MTTSSIWATWFKARYLKNKSIWSQNNPFSCSCIWRKIRALSGSLLLGNEWKVGDGKLIHWWFDCWLDDYPLVTKFPWLSFSPTDTVSLPIDDGWWVIPPQIPLQIRQHLQLASIINIPSPQVVDSIKLTRNASRNLSLKNAWHVARSRALALNWSNLVPNKLVNPASFLPNLEVVPKTNINLKLG